MIKVFIILIGLFSCLLISCTPKKETHSFANIDEVTIKHIHLDLETDFENNILKGKAELTLDNFSRSTKLILDSWDLQITKIVLDDGKETDFHLGAYRESFGQPLSVSIKPETKKITIFYSTSPNAQALQWLSPQQTLDKKHPFLFSQSQSIYARSWIPCQDTPLQRITYSANIKTDPELLALMSADNPQAKNDIGLYSFEMKQPIPVYLIALAVGDMEFRSLGERSGVYAEKAMIERASFEFSDTEDMLLAAESLYGPYQWERYDILLLPASFPFGGMENPRLTFATPTLIAGDKSLVSTIAHEIAHAWSGNLVTNAYWDDFWLNEGFTSYIELRILEQIYGAEYALMIEQIGYQDMLNILNNLGPNNPKTKLSYDLTEKHPEDYSAVAYDKGARFLKTLESAYGREKFDRFLRDYFSEFAFQTITAEQFIAFLRENLIQKETLSTSKAVKIYDWIYNPGIPTNHPVPDSPEFRKVDQQRSAFIKGTPASDLETANWTSHHWVHFIKALPGKITLAQMTDLDNNFQFSTISNSEIAFVWYKLAIIKNYKDSYPALEKFLTNVGRIKFVAPLYRALAVDEAGKKMAIKIFQKARAGYHPLTISEIDAIIKG